MRVAKEITSEYFQDIDIEYLVYTRFVDTPRLMEFTHTCQPGIDIVRSLSAIDFYQVHLKVCRYLLERSMTL